MKKLKINASKLQLHKNKIATLSSLESNHILGGLNVGGDSEICPSIPIKLSDGCPPQPGTAWCPVSSPTPPRPGG